MQRYLDVALMLGSIGLYSMWATVDARKRAKESARSVRAGSRDQP